MIIGTIFLLSWIFLPVVAKKRGNLNTIFVLVLIFFGPLAIFLALRTPSPKTQTISNEGIPNISISFSQGEHTNSDYQYIPPKDERQAICPNCHSKLKKIPGARTKCPECGKHMLVRTDPHTRIRKVVTEEQANAIDDEIARLNGTYELKVAEKNRREKIRKDLRESFKGVEPSDKDVEWRILNEDSIKYAREGDWVSYGINRNQMAHALEERGKFKAALERYFEVMILDLVGIQDISGVKDFDAEMRKLLDIRQFKPEEGKIHDAQLENILRLAKQMEINKDTLESIFHDEFGKLNYIKFPMTSVQCWEKISNKIGNSL